MSRHHSRSTAIFLTLALSWALGVGAASKSHAADTDVAFFESRIRPLLVEHCQSCHGADEQESDLRLDTWAGLSRGGAGGPLFVAGKPDESLLIAAVRRAGELKMPPEQALPATAVADLERWIALGAPHPDRDGDAPRPVSRIDWEAARAHWAFQPLSPVAPPAVRDVAWSRTAVDLFVLARLEEAGLTPSPEAERSTWLRRVTLDLTGLPPTPAEADAFLADEAPGAHERVVDRLLASPRYGERWGRHWLDVARYSDSNGLDENIAHGTAWLYRDYVVDAFNDDLPYAQFVREQIAGDLLEGEDSARRREALVATGFLALGPKVLAEVDELKMEMDIIDEQLDTLFRSMLGLTIGCARCHDHKFDPLTQQDYYALAGIFKSTRTMEHFKKIARWHENRLPPTTAERRIDERLATEIAEAERERDRWKQLAKGGAAAAGQSTEGQSTEDPKARLKAAEETIKRLQTEREVVGAAMGVLDREPTDLRVHLRGSHLTLGSPAPRRFPAILTADEHAPALQGSGRLELSHWLSEEQWPLLSRVFVNRVWRWHFGRGLVGSPDNFGLLGETPSHPELLDYLAAELLRGDGSLKRLHRQLVLSSVYRQSSHVDPARGALDPDNRLWWRMPVRRLEAEAVRDSLLFAADELDLTMGGSLLHVADREFLFNHTSQDNTKYDAPRRSLYLPVVRNHLYDVFELFDFGDGTVSNGDRASSVVAPQSLFLLNGPLVVEAASRLASQVDDRGAERVRRLYRTALGRSPTDAETTTALGFVARFCAIEGVTLGAAEAEQDPAATAAARRAWSTLAQTLLISNEFLYLR